MSNNNLMMLLPLLMGMNGNQSGNNNMTEMLLKMMSNPDMTGGGNVNPMMLLAMSLMSQKNGGKSCPPPNKRDGAGENNCENSATQNQSFCGNSTVNSFGAIENFSGNAVLEAMKILMQNRK